MTRRDVTHHHHGNTKSSIQALTENGRVSFCCRGNETLWTSHSAVSVMPAASLLMLSRCCLATVTIAIFSTGCIQQFLIRKHGLTQKHVSRVSVIPLQENFITSAVFGVRIRQRMARTQRVYSAQLCSEREVSLFSKHSRSFKAGFRSNTGEVYQ